MRQYGCVIFLTYFDFQDECIPTVLNHKNCSTYLELLFDLVLKKSALFLIFAGVPLPESGLKLMIDESSVVLTDSERVQPKRQLEGGYELEYSTIQESLNGLK